MPHAASFNLTPRTWTLLTPDNVLSCTIQNRDQTYAILLKATAGTTPPTDDQGAIAFGPREGITSDTPLSTFFSGVPGANRVWAYCSMAAKVTVHYA